MKLLLCSDFSDVGYRWIKKFFKNTKGLSVLFVGYAKEMVGAQKWKFQRENMQIDCNMFVVTYVIPVILEYKGNMSEAFAQAIADHWDEAFGTNMECGTYEMIFGGFKTSIFGIPFGNGK